VRVHTTDAIINIQVTHKGIYMQLWLSMICILVYHLVTQLCLKSDYFEWQFDGMHGFMVGVANGKSETRRDAETLVWKSEPETMSTKIRARDAKNTYMQKRDSKTQHKGFRDFEIGRKFAETQDFQRTIRHPSQRHLHATLTFNDMHPCISLSYTVMPQEWLLRVTIWRHGFMRESQRSLL